MPDSHSPVHQSTNRAVHRAVVISVAEVAPAHFQLQLNAPLLAQSAKPGQFVHILTTPGATEWVYDPLLRRAFSVMNVNTPQGESITVLFRVGGRGTQALAKARVGDEIDLLGPLGQPFDLSPFESSSQQENLFHVKQTSSNAILIGGGVGVPPLIYLGQVLHERGILVDSIIGARSSAEIIGFDELSSVSENVAVTTDDGSRGHHGRVTELLALSLNSLSNEIENSVTKPIVYACGPLPMLRAVAKICATAQVRCQVSLEENMPCGIGVCNGCVVRTRQPFANTKENVYSESEPVGDLNRILGSEWSSYRTYRRVCVEGPACWADEIDWEHQL